MKLLTHKFAAGVQHQHPEPRLFLENKVQLPEMAVGGPLLLEDDPRHISALSDTKIGHRRYEAVLVFVGADVALDHGGLRVRLERDCEAGMKRAAGRYLQF